ncbi:lipoprotein, partial [Pseudomonas syringae pv. actinidiae ICMP 19096]
MRLTLLLSSLLLVACSSGNAITLRTNDTPLNQLSEVNAKLAFTCVHEKIPTPSTETDVMFQYARWLQKSNQIQQDETVDVEIGRLYRIAADLTGGERLRLSQQLIDAHVASGYYMIAIYLQKGAAGLQQDENMSLRYFRKAADEGNAQAQTYVADKLAPFRIAPDIARQMRRCAAEQGNSDAAVALGFDLKTDKKYQEALEAFQRGVASGDETAASFLGKIFRNPKPDDRMYYMDQKEDLQRAERYKQISKILNRLSYANPKVPEINEIVPLPPAKLPAWDGKLKWVDNWLRPWFLILKQVSRCRVPRFIARKTHHIPMCPTPVCMCRQYRRMQIRTHTPLRSGRQL